MISESGMTEMLLTNKPRCVKINKRAGFGDTFAAINMDYTITFLIESDKGGKQCHNSAGFSFALV